MSDVKTLIDEYAAENNQLKAALQELQTALYMAVLEAGTPSKDGSIVLAVPASVRKTANNTGNLTLKWSSPGDITRGSLRLKINKGKVDNDS